MVCTDLFGRGIDIERVNVVIQYDMAESADAYLHRVGRAGRFGTKGLTISFITTTEDADVLKKVEERFVVDVPDLPAEVDPSTYSTHRLLIVQWVLKSWHLHLLSLVGRCVFDKPYFFAVSGRRASSFLTFTKARHHQILCIFRGHITCS